MNAKKSYKKLRMKLAKMRNGSDYKNTFELTIRKYLRLSEYFWNLL